MYLEIFLQSFMITQQMFTAVIIGGMGDQS